jgi:cytochrome c oxidase subunit 2
LKNGKTVKADENYIKDSILNPNKQIVKGYQPVMPKGLVSKSQDVQALVAYIKSLK